ncbi:acetate--CoA ligase [Corallococcus exiguus]|uniref:acetate--CoA ligase n=1 Tax=Corallococcus TaxID=83461 RepID=UPI000EB895E0|nr:MULTISPECIES: acetate--CoA ligase [Corallococcus]NNC03766.1 acetate--CoA ligase [Corallococcus exiguus]NPC47664.1 acetate--CoA ligase [Corallococcus exiguus]RKH77179.1 acetate--CoA ligase [Corallococcus sp. AB032C]
MATDTDSLFQPKEAFRRTAHVQSLEEYQRLYRQSLDAPDAFWGEQARQLTWFHPPESIREVNEQAADFAWFVGGKLNVTVNCVDRHAKARPDKAAILWAKNTPGEYETITFRDLAHHVNRLANVLKAHGVRKGDRVIVYLPMIPELVYSLLACARIGAVHSVVFAGFSADSLRERVLDSGAKVVITANEGPRGPKSVATKAITDEALDGLPQVTSVLVARRTPKEVPMREGRDHWLDVEVQKHRGVCPAEWMDAEDPLFILYTSGSTGKPKGVLHTTGGYLVYANTTFRYIFDTQPDDVHFCTADVGWVTGHSYLVYGPLSTGTTTVLFESTPTWPDASRLWQVVDDLKATTLYTAPTALRSLIKEGDSFVTKSSRKSLRLLGSVGEPINPEVWRWFHEVVGEGRCPVVDTWWQTETGGILIAPLPGATPCKPGSATLPFFGVEPVLVDEEGKKLEGNGVNGNLCLARSWPGQARTLYGHHSRFVETYYARFLPLYFTGDGCRRDEDGYYWITGRVDDVLNVSGHRLGTAEVESALVAHEAVAEAAVVGFPHELKGTGVCAFVTVKPDFLRTPDEKMVGSLREQVRHVIGPIATPDRVVLVSGLPKTRSGKILRRMLRKIAGGETENLGDASTLADPTVLDELLTKGLPPASRR